MLVRSIRSDCDCHDHNQFYNSSKTPSVTKVEMIGICANIQSQHGGTSFICELNGLRLEGVQEASWTSYDLAGGSDREFRIMTGATSFFAANTRRASLLDRRTGRRVVTVINTLTRSCL